MDKTPAGIYGNSYCILTVFKEGSRGCDFTSKFYVDDVLLASPSKSASETDSRVLLKALSSKEHKVSKAKLKLVSERVRYLEHELLRNTRQLTQDRVKAICSTPLPRTKKEMKHSPCMSGYCRQWIMNYSKIIRPLLDMPLCSLPEDLVWNEASWNAFQNHNSPSYQHLLWDYRTVLSHLIYSFTTSQVLRNLS